MKLRIHGNSVRLRLTKGDFAHFGEMGCVEEKADFGVGLEEFRYALYRTQNGDTMHARLENNCLSVLVPSGGRQTMVRIEANRDESYAANS